MLRRLLTPKILDTESAAPNAEMVYKHWKMTFMNCLQSNVFSTVSTTTTDNNNTTSDESTASATASNVTEVTPQDKLSALTNFVSAEIWGICSDAQDFDSAIRLLDAAYIKPVNVIYNRQAYHVFTGY